MFICTGSKARLCGREEALPGLAHPSDTPPATQGGLLSHMHHSTSLEEYQSLSEPELGVSQVEQQLQSAYCAEALF